MAAEMLRWELGAKKDNQRALTYYLQAANQGYDLAQFRIGEWYAADDSEIGTNYPEALNWALKARDAGEKRANLVLGKIYSDGLA